MSEHKWILENLASYNAGGLEPDERERLEEHIAECSACAQALVEARSLDQTLEALFMEARPSATLEDRMIQSLRTRPARNGLFLRIAMSAAAVLLFGVVGAGASYM